eukprot:Nitzschia sp. Nitz4//scaffold383_size13514//2938//3510//NITZ4_008974-RA/size13514-processed-gene-0.2-mRNA-1//1//CDS//3329549933//8797//frame0
MKANNNIVFRWFVSVVVLLALVVPSSQVHVYGLTTSSQQQDHQDTLLVLTMYHGYDNHIVEEDNNRIERGQTVQIAIQPADQETRIVRVDDITFTQNEGRFVKAQRAVRNGKADARFAGLSCWDGELCVVETKLLDKFYTNSMATITIQGFVTVSPPGRTRGGGGQTVHKVSMTLVLDNDNDEEDAKEQD